MFGSSDSPASTNDVTFTSEILGLHFLYDTTSAKTDIEGIIFYAADGSNHRIGENMGYTYD